MTTTKTTQSPPDAGTVADEPMSSAAIRDRMVEVDGQIAGLETQRAGLIDRLSDPAHAAAAERELAGAEGLLRHRRGERVGLAQDLVEAERRELAARQRPYRAVLDKLVREDLAAAAATYRQSLEAALVAGRALAQVLHDTGVMAESAGHRRAAELQHPTPDELAGGAPGRLALPLTVNGIAYALAPAHHAGDRLLSLDALPRLVAEVQTIIANEGGTE